MNRKQNVNMKRNTTKLLKDLLLLKELKKLLKNLNHENKRIDMKKSLEFKQLQSEIEDVRKYKNSLSVALKAAKAESKDQNKIFEKKTTKWENVILELSEFKQMKLAEEREEKMKKRIIGLNKWHTNILTSVFQIH
jgi:hypothetical protein